MPYRILGESWWPQELPTAEEMAEGMRNLENVKYKVDYVITHCASDRIQNMIDPGPGQLLKEDVLTRYFQKLEEKLRYKMWYFGHYHMDARIDEKHMLRYKNIVRLE